MFAKGLKHGRGDFQWNDGSYFKGNFVYDCMEGYGVYQWSDNTNYEGDWKEGKMHG